MVPLNSGTHMNRMVLFGVGILAEAISVCMVRAISMSSPLPEALSLALGCGWQRWAITKISSSGFSEPWIVAVTTSRFPGNSRALTLAWSLTVFLSLRRFLRWFPWRFDRLKPNRTLDKFSALGHMPWYPWASGMSMLSRTFRNSCASVSVMTPAAPRLWTASSCTVLARPVASTSLFLMSLPS